MTALFGRVYKLELGSDDDVITFDGMESVSRDNQNGYKYPAQIVFLVDQTPAAWRSYAEITVYGVSRERRKAIYERYSSVRLTAGYKNSFGTIFNGQIENIENGRDGPDTYIKLFCQSSANEWPDAYINKSFGNGTPQENIIRAVASTFGVPVEIIGDFSNLPRALNGLTLSRDSKNVLNEMAGNFEFEWMVENGSLIILKDGASREDSDVFKFSATSGLIGSPAITVKGVDINVLLNPHIRPRDEFEVEAVTGKLVFNSVYYYDLKDISTGEGVHQVVSLTHEGSYYDEVWNTGIEGLRPHAI